MSWQETCLGNHIDLISGAAFKSAVFTDNENDVPLIKGENIGQGKILWDKSRYWPAGDIDRHERCLLKPGDVILAMDRPWVTAGLKFAQIKESDPLSLLVQRVARMRGTNGLETNYLRYIIGSKPFSDYVKNIMRGTNVPHISGGQIKAYKFFLPPNGQQNAIINYLFPYDDLIENNRRRIALLEEAARQLYKEWFVRFRFPGHEHTKIIDGVPEGWKTIPFSGLADFINGFAFKPSHLGDSGFPVVKIPELKDGISGKTPRNSGLEVPEKYHLVDGDLLFSWSGTLAVNLWSCGAALLNQHLFKVATFGDVSEAFLMFALREAMPHFLNETTGATMKHIRRSALDKVCATIPPKKTLEEFEEVATGAYQQLLCLNKQINSLKSARDILLPKLMNGEIAV